MPFRRILRTAVAFSCLVAAASAADPVTVDLWPGGAPDEKQTFGDEKDQSEPGKGLVAGKPVIRLGNVTKPMITIYKPPADKDTGAAVLVCPGGGYHILAYDLEGTEVCEWFNSIGVTAVLLKYRVPRRDGLSKHAPPLQDAQRAMGLLRQRAQEFGIDPHRIGVLGFSAGGHLSAALSTNFSRRTYAEVDSADRESCRPDFVVLVYPGYLVEKDRPNEVASDLPVTSETPPTFLVMTQDDGVGVENVFGYASALNKAKVPCEVHVYPRGGHGYGLRKTELPVTSWPDRVADWMRDGQWLKAR